MNDTGTAAARRFSERLDELRVRAAWYERVLELVRKWAPPSLFAAGAWAIVWLYSWMLYPYW